MTKYEDTPEQAEASIRASGDEISRLDNALGVAEARSEQLEDEMDDAEGEELSKLEQEHARVQQEIEDINTDLAGAHQHHIHNVDFWHN